MRTGLDGALAITGGSFKVLKEIDNPRTRMDDERAIAGKRKQNATHRTSMVRASDDAKRAKSFSIAGGSTGTAVLPFAVAAAAAADNDCW
jgi:hypothetical protein